MNFGDLLPQVYRLVQDEGQFAWTNTDVALHLNEAVRKVADGLGNADARLAINMVAGTAEYLLPQGVRRINSVRILPEIPAGGSQGKAGPPLHQVPSLETFPVVNLQDAEPCRYVLSLVAGANENQFQLIFNPTPARTATGAIIVNIGNEYLFTSNDPADGTDLAQIIPFPEQYKKVIYYLTAAEMLGERPDENDIQRGNFFEGKGLDILAPMLPVKSTQARASVPRAFP